MAAKKNKSKQIENLVMPNGVFKGTYSNTAFVYHTKREFVMDFILGLNDSAELVSRVIMSPEHAKEFQKALSDNIKMFDANLSRGLCK